MDQRQFNRRLLEFLAASPTPFHAVEQMSARLTDAGFVPLCEADAWQVEAGGRYFTTRNGSSIIAWRMPGGGTADLSARGFRMVGAHTDSPCLKLKPRPVLYRNGYLQLGVEVYGGVLLNPWFDRDLSIAGRVSYETSAGAVSHALIDFREPVAVIPSLAIHLDRDANSNRSINAQIYLPPIIAQRDGTVDFGALLEARLEADGVSDVRRVLDHDLLLYDTQPPRLIGLHQEWIASARLDNLLSCFVGLTALSDTPTDCGAILVCNDHEEVGSASAAGASGPMLAQLLERLLPDPDARGRALARSLLVSTDNAHGLHPNFADRHDAAHGPLLNRGAVLKINANQRYASTGETGAIFRKLAAEVEAPVQTFVMRSDLACGSTIGPLTAAQIGVRTLDVGVPQWAMHSIREVAGTTDAYQLSRILGRFFTAARV